MIPWAVIRIVLPRHVHHESMQLDVQYELFYISVRLQKKIFETMQLDIQYELFYTSYEVVYVNLNDTMSSDSYHTP